MKHTRGNGVVTSAGPSARRTRTGVTHVVVLDRRAAVMAACLAFLPCTAAAQIRPMGAESRSRIVAPEGSATATVRGWYAELQRLSGHLKDVHDEALRDPELRSARDSLMDALKEAMDRSDPSLQRLTARLDQIPGEMETARARGDAPRFRALDQELAQISARFMNAEAVALRQPALARRVRAYEEMLRSRMMEIEPMTDSLLARSRELQRLLQAALGAQRR